MRTPYLLLSLFLPLRSELHHGLEGRLASQASSPPSYYVERKKNAEAQVSSQLKLTQE